MTVIARPRNNYGFLFGSGVDGDVTISANTNLTSTLNGGIVFKNYMNLTINSGCTLSVSNPCKGLWIRVRGTLTLNGNISMSNKGCYIAGGGSDLYLCYSDIKVPKVGAAGGAALLDAIGNGNAGAAGTDGKCGGGGSGASHSSGFGMASGAGASGGVFGGGTGGSGNIGGYCAGYIAIAGEAGQSYGLRGGNGKSATNMNGTGRNCYSGGGAGGVTGGTVGGGTAQAGNVGSGGVLVVMANHVVGAGQLLAKGANGGRGMKEVIDENTSVTGGGGGGSGGGSITLFYYSMSGTPTFNADGGAGGSGNNAYAGGAGGAGSCRDYSLAELLSHTRV